MHGKKSHENIILSIFRKPFIDVPLRTSVIFELFKDIKV
jgi:hypothetical protein